MARSDTQSNSPALVRDTPAHGSNTKTITPKGDNEETRRIRQTLHRWHTFASAFDSVESTETSSTASLSPRRVRKVVGGGAAAVSVSPMSARKPPPASSRPMLPPPSHRPNNASGDSPSGFVRNQRRLSISSTRICANLASPISTSTDRRSAMATMHGQSARGLSCCNLLVTDSKPRRAIS
jgi:hypothetical protein